MGTAEAVDLAAVQVIRDVAAELRGEGGEDVTAVAPLDRVGNLLPVNGAVGEDLWGGFKAFSVSVWGGVTSNMHRGRFMDQVASAGWTDPSGCSW